jgi:hypothetical protein
MQRREFIISLSSAVAQFALEAKLPSVSGWSPFAQKGLLMTYGPNVRELYRSTRTESCAAPSQPTFRSRYQQNSISRSIRGRPKGSASKFHRRFSRVRTKGSNKRSNVRYWHKADCVNRMAGYGGSADEKIYNDRHRHRPPNKDESVKNETAGEKPVASRLPLPRRVRQKVFRSILSIP